MKKLITLMFIAATLLFVGAFYGCSKSSSTTPTPTKTNTQLLIQNGDITWTNTAGTFYSGPNATGTARVATGQDIGADGAFALGAVTFTTDSLILSYYSYNGYGKIKWSVTNTKPAELTVNFGTYIDGTPNMVEGVQVLKAQIVSLTETKLVIMVNSTFNPDSQSYVETFTASPGIVTF